jgi:hypothetical protein
MALLASAQAAFVGLSFGLSFGFASIAYGAIERPQLSRDWVISGAQQSLRACAAKSSVLWGRLLDQVDPDGATLYRLAWLQKGPRSAARTSANPADDGGWKWKESAELWVDENEGRFQSTRCVSENDQVSAHQDLPQDLLDGLLLSQVESYVSLRAPLREAVRDRLKSKLLAGEAVELQPLDPTFLQAHADEACEWETLRLLQSKQSVSELVRRCAKAGAPLDAKLRAPLFIAWGDELVKKGRFAEAIPAYRSALGIASQLDPDAAIDSRIWYRIALASGLSRVDDEAFFRAAEKTLSGLRAESLYQSVVSNLFCERIAELKPRGALRTLSKVYGAKRPISASWGLLGRCEGERMREFWSVGLTQSEAPRQKALLAGRLLELALQAGGLEEARRWTAWLAKSSRQAGAEFAARRGFWSALEAAPALAPQLLKGYRAQASWSSFDEQKERRLQARLIALQQEKTLDSETPARAVQLPLLSLPAIESWSFGVQTDFQALFYKARDAS